MPNVDIVEDVTAVGQIGDRMVFPGIDSCLAIALVTGEALIGHHLVQFDGMNRPYTDRIDDIYTTLNTHATGKTVTNVVVAGALDMYPAGFEDAINAAINGARPPAGLVAVNSSDHGTVNIEVTRNTVKVYSREASGKNNAELNSTAL